MISRMLGQICSLVRRCAQDEIVESDLALGVYEVIFEQRAVTHREYTVYDHRTKVQKGGKILTVLSQQPLPARFSVVADGFCNKVVRVCTHTAQGAK